MSDEVIVSNINAIMLITLNRPEKRNALNASVVADLHEAVRDAAKDDAIRVVVLQGEGEAFCAGADLEYLLEISANSPEENAADSRTLYAMLSALRALPKPTIAKVHGPALAGGCGLAIACDIVVADDDAKFGFTEVRIGFVPAIVTPLLVERVGMGNARELLLRGNIIDADTAQQIGLVNYVVGPEELDVAAEKLAFEIAERTSPQAVRLTKQLLADTAGMGTVEAMEYAAVYNALARTSADFRKGLTAFLNKERPIW
ncbi:MAG: enoyl-CoA hydratase/isomerase family protein [Ignavibacteria bacterium]|nr:enoyl-CoA hydratase/isomerase family protein [Ignavibacteria bacterium]